MSAVSIQIVFAPHMFEIAQLMRCRDKVDEDGDEDKRESDRETVVVVVPIAGVDLTQGNTNTNFLVSILHGGTTSRH